MTDTNWKTIDSAPKNKQALFYHPDVYRDRPARQKTHAAVMRVGFLHEWPNRMPTHWMPLPKPPSNEVTP